ncbi:MAG: histidine kinase [Verrucomicrobia bacterium]|nr:histidine kinase [Verrucomicrobiota bacterium]
MPNVLNHRSKILIVCGACLAFWTLLTLAMAGYFFLAVGFSWEQALRISVRDWAPWALLSPLVVWLTQRLPFERKMLLLSVPGHLAGCALAVLACGWIADWMLPPTPWWGDWQQRRQQSLSGTNAPSSSVEERMEPKTDRSRGWSPERRGRRPSSSSWFWLRARSHVPVYWVIVCAVHALTYYRRSQERERNALELSASLAQARLQALKMQLHPHFLFNALNAIATLVHKDPHAADDMIANLSNLLRLALDRSNLHEVSLRKELEFLDCYLEIEQMRLGNRLRVEKHIEPAMLNALVPVMIFQPLAENAVRHGIEPMRNPGVVTICAAREGMFLNLTVSNSGTGVFTSPPAASRPGIGVANTRARLQELYGTDAQLVMQPAADGGFSVSVQIPLRFEPAGPEPEPKAST